MLLFGPQLFPAVGLAARSAFARGSRTLFGLALIVTLLLPVGSISAGLAAAAQAQPATGQAAEASTGGALVFPPAGDIKVDISGLHDDSGVVRVALFASVETYNNDHNTGMGAFRQIIAAPKNGAASVTFPAMPYGQYAVKMFHDRDNSGRFYRAPFGRPRVEYGVSNNPRTIHWIPAYKKAAISLDRAELIVPIRPEHEK
ncbi:MAG: DUF2141 domain-containing protein [Cyanobacteria bacterium REEB67]|nr:DUF2141 domain-containing protein [Cyanobacteria bacterium REEB67]